MSHEPRPPALSRWAIPAATLLLGALLTGCAGNTDYQDALVKTAQSGQSTLPRGEGIGAPIPLWDSVFVVCPYSDTTDAPEPFAKEALALDTSSNESAHWLLFADGDNVKRMSADRTAVDFCLAGAVNNVYQHTQVWSAEKSDGAWLMTAVDPQQGG
ncbi:hypothetical protein [Arthrobacter sp. PAMC 25486]|uniref:hypothetical protein n=1 Tax=Arthrobacter sp. PAMC 25486 TaxID=1494608 RepID=UPI0012FEE99B|nr:hypothetical protein [Arthrobacter sp. PAMC 25486]